MAANSTFGAQILTAVLIAGLICRVSAGSTSRGAGGDDDGSSLPTSDEGVREVLKNSSIWQLQKDLYANYIPTVRPVKNVTSPVMVQVDFILFNLISLDEQAQIFVTNAELVLVWKDIFLTWDPNDYGGVKQMRMDPNKIWRPDVVLYNSASLDYNAGLIMTYAMVQFDGTVRFLVNGAFQSVCNTLNVDYFPFDEQTCYLKFACWTQDVSAVRLTPASSKADITAYTELGEFKLISVNAAKHTDRDPCCPGTTFDDVMYYVKIHRRPMFYIINYIFPSILINAIGCMVFYVPCDSGEKITLGISAMLTMVVFLMAMTDAMPPAPATPLLSVYYCACVVLVTLEVLFSILVLNIFHRGQYGKRASDPTIAMAVVMAKITFTELKDPSGHFADRRAEMALKFRSFCCREKNPETTVGPTEVTENKMGESMRSLADKLAEEEFWKPGVKQMPFYATPGRLGDFASPEEDFAAKFGLKGYRRAVDDTAVPVVPNANLKLESGVAHLVKQADKALEIMALTQLSFNENTYKESLSMEFMELARIYDRFFLILSVVGTAVTSIGILMSSPYSTSATV